MGSIEKGTITFTECKIEEAENCELEKTTIESKEIKGLIGYDGTKVVFLLQPTVAGGDFATVKLKSIPPELCTIAGKYQLAGSLVGEIPSADLNVLSSSTVLSLKKTGSSPNFKQELETFEEPILKTKITEVHLVTGGHPSAIETQMTLSITGEKLGIFTS
jgi:hypothetical protein